MTDRHRAHNTAPDAHSAEGFFCAISEAQEGTPRRADTPPDPPTAPAAKARHRRRQRPTAAAPRRSWTRHADPPPMPYHENDVKDPYQPRPLYPIPSKANPIQPPTDPAQAVRERTARRQQEQPAGTDDAERRSPADDPTEDDSTSGADADTRPDRRHQRSRHQQNRQHKRSTPAEPPPEPIITKPT